MSVHVEPIKTYVAVFVALMAGTALTVFVAYFDLSTEAVPGRTHRAS
jgi:hypothetical protein